MAKYKEKTSYNFNPLKQLPTVFSKHAIVQYDVIIVNIIISTLTSECQAHHMLNTHTQLCEINTKWCSVISTHHVWNENVCIVCVKTTPHFYSAAASWKLWKFQFINFIASLRQASKQCWNSGSSLKCKMSLCFCIWITEEFMVLILNLKTLGYVNCSCCTPKRSVFCVAGVISEQKTLISLVNTVGVSFVNRKCQGGS